jgi:hypothetical protein
MLKASFEGHSSAGLSDGLCSGQVHILPPGVYNLYVLGFMCTFDYY